jgi:hypothetical protein
LERVQEAEEEAYGYAKCDDANSTKDEGWMEDDVIDYFGLIFELSIRVPFKLKREFFINSSNLA